jgi:UDP-N-acetylmuramoyl-L-alanyl-D-glutamate--2,6-diaminopimelate ligase
MKRLSALWPNSKMQAECGFHGLKDPCIESLSFDSRTCSPKSMYFAFEGKHVDGHEFIPEAISSGALCIVHSKPLPTYLPDIAYIQSSHPRRLLSGFSAALYDHPEKRLRIIGVTGTDGKTTTCEFMWQFLQNHGVRCGLLDTVNIYDGTTKRRSPYRQSTPEPTIIYPFLCSCLEHGLDTVVLEATSHGLSFEYARLADIPFSIAIYTTFTSEHLEFHHSLEHYLQAKLNLARQLLPNACVILPEEFPFIKQVERAAPTGTYMRTYSVDKKDSNAEIAVKTQTTTLERRYYSLLSDGNMIRSSIPFGPDFFLKNALGAVLGAAQVTQNPPRVFLRETAWLEPVAGRFEIIATHLGFTVIIDFAHTADAFAKLFSQIRALRPSGKLVAVFGAAGDRDQSKRAPMGEQAAIWCDAVFLTDEDPRGEPSQAIIQDIRHGIPTSSKVQVYTIEDRSKAILEALRYCSKGDTLALLGKGHESTIQYTSDVIPWDERAMLTHHLDTLAQNNEENKG